MSLDLLTGVVDPRPVSKWINPRVCDRPCYESVSNRENVAYLVCKCQRPTRLLTSSCTRGRHVCRILNSWTLELLNSSIYVTSGFSTLWCWPLHDRVVTYNNTFPFPSTKIHDWYWQNLAPNGNLWKPIFGKLSAVPCAASVNIFLQTNICLNIHNKLCLNLQLDTHTIAWVLQASRV